MPKKSLESLTESMFYVLMAFCRGPMCGIDAAAFIAEKTGGSLAVGPATLYTILGKFEKEGYLKEIATDGRKRTYAITEKGLAAYDCEVARLRRCVADAGERREAPPMKHRKRQSTRVWRFPPCPAYDVEATESWLPEHGRAGTAPE